MIDIMVKIVDVITYYLIQIVALFVGSFSAVYATKWIPDRRDGAINRVRYVYRPLLSEVNRVIGDIQSLKATLFHLDSDSYLNLLISNREQIELASKACERYRDMLLIAKDVVEKKIRKIAERKLKNLEGKMKDEELKIANTWKSPSEFFAYKDMLLMFMERCIEGNKISYSWFEESYPRYAEELQLLISNTGDSLNIFFNTMNNELKKDSSLLFLREEMEKALNEAERVRGILDNHVKKLKSWYGVLYGWGDKEKLEELIDATKSR